MLTGALAVQTLRVAKEATNESLSKARQLVSQPKVIRIESDMNGLDIGEYDMPNIAHMNVSESTKLRHTNQSAEPIIK